jgi:hypothetical protein
MMPPPAVAFFHLFQFLPLFVSKIDTNLSVRVRHDFMYTLGGTATHFLELLARFIDNRRNFGDLFRRQTEFRPKMLLHSCARHSWMVKLKEKISSVQATQSGASDSAGDEYKEETGYEFPFQCFVHWENSS